MKQYVTGRSRSRRISAAHLLPLAAFVAATLSSCLFAADEADVACSTLERLVAPVGTTERDGRIELEMPSGERLSIASDFTMNPDARLYVPAKAFVDAGLDPSKLKEGVSLNPEKSFLIFDVEASDSKTAYGSLKDALAGLFFRSPRLFSSWGPVHRYGIRFPHGTLFEWSSDPEAEGEEFFVSFDPETLLQAGLDPMRLHADWKIVTEPGDDGAGRPMGIRRLTRFFNLH
jgi:hypothetical protein